MNRSEEEDYIKGKRQRLRELLELEEYNLRLELHQKQEAQKFGYLNNLREQVKEIREAKMQRDICQNNQSSRNEFDPRQPFNSNQAREQYGNDLKEQMRIKEENLAKLKKEDEQYEKIMKEMEAKQLEKDKEEQLKRKNMQLQYTNDLRNQLSDISHKKEEDLKSHNESSRAFNVIDQSHDYKNFGVDNNSPSVLMKKQQNRDEYKKALDEQLMSNLKIRDDKKRDDANEAQDTFHIGAVATTNAERLESQAHELKDQEDFLEVVRQEKKVTHDEEAVLEKTYDTNNANEIFQCEEDKKKQEILDRNKQYQADLLAQIKEKKERKDYY